MYTHDFSCPVWIDGLHIADVECRVRFTATPVRPAWFNPATGYGEPADGGEVEVVEVVMLGTKPDPAALKDAGQPGGKPERKTWIKSTGRNVFAEFEAPVPSWLDPHVDAYLDRYEQDLIEAADDAGPDDDRADYEYDRRRDERMEAAMTQAAE